MTEVAELFRNYNMYRRAVRRDLAKPLTHVCGTEYVSGYGPDDEFVLNCYTCDTTTTPGIAILEKINLKVEEVFDVSKN